MPLSNQAGALRHLGSLFAMQEEYLATFLSQQNLSSTMHVSYEIARDVLSQYK